MKKTIPNTTPKSNVEKKSTSEKKLVQARLPFKVLSTTSSTETTAAATTSSSSTQESRKRRLSYSPEKNISTPKHTKKIIVSAQLKENLDSKDSGSSIVISDDESPLSDNNEGDDIDEFNISASSSSSQIKSLSSNNKLIIKLPLGSANKKRKKSKFIIRSKLEDSETSSDPEIVLEEKKRLKKTKIDDNISSSSVITAVSTTTISIDDDDTEPEIKLQEENWKVEELKNAIKENDKDEIIKVLNTSSTEIKSNSMSPKLENKLISKTITTTSKILSPSPNIKDLTPPSLENKNKRGKLELDNQKRNEIEKEKREEKEQKEKLKPKEKEEFTSNEEEKKEETRLVELKSQREILKDEELKTDIKATDKIENEVMNTSTTEIKSSSNETIAEEMSLNIKNENKTNKEEIILEISDDEKKKIEYNKNESKSISLKNNDSEKIKNLESSISPKQENKSINKTTTITNKISSPSPNIKNLTPPSLKNKKETAKQVLEKQKRKEIEEQKRKEREEKEEMKRKEKQEKEDLKRKEKEEKEKKRLAELELKNEEKRQREDEKRKKDEQKEEERKKRDDEKRKKELEKEEAENKERKAAAAFTNYFRPKKTGSSKINVDEDQSAHGSSCNQLVNCAFMPFQVKADMKLAPLIRKTINSVSKKNLDEIINDDICRDLPDQKLYLKQLRTGIYVANKLNKIQVDVSDVVIVEDELLGVGQSINEASKLEQMYKAKYLNFHENRRPPYYGTWRKKSEIIGPRKPFSHDTVYFDYDADSDDEWEEEEPGESLHGSDDEKESEDEYEVDNEFFVPHGHLSDEELQDEDDETEQDNSPECQKAKLKILQVEFAKQMKKKTEKIKPRLIGIVWVDENGNKPDNCSNAIWESLNKCAMIVCGDSPLKIEPPVNKNMEAGPPILQVNKKQSSKRNELTEELIVDLIRLVHGNRHKRTFLINEFQEFIAEKFKINQPEYPFIEYSKTVIKEKINKISRWSILEDQESKNKKKKLCWIVSSDILNTYNLQDISLLNTWNYILPPSNWNSVDKSKHTKQNTNEHKIIEQKNNHTKEISSDIKVFTEIKSDITKCEKMITNQSSNAISDSVIKDSSVESVKEFQKLNTNVNASTENVIVKDTPVIPDVIKKRVPLLMSVPIGQAIPETFKNELISNFLKKSKDKSETATASTTKNISETINDPFPVNPDSVIIID